jgi:hypothetical protein
VSAVETVEYAANVQIGPCGKPRRQGPGASFPRPEGGNPAQGENRNVGGVEKRTGYRIWKTGHGARGAVRAISATIPTFPQQTTATAVYPYIFCISGSYRSRSRRAGARGRCAARRRPSLDQAAERARPVRPVFRREAPLLHAKSPARMEWLTLQHAVLQCGQTRSPPNEHQRQRQMHQKRSRRIAG